MPGSIPSPPIPPPTLYTVGLKLLPGDTRGSAECLDALIAHKRCAQASLLVTQQMRDRRVLMKVLQDAERVSLHDLDPRPVRLELVVHGPNGLGNEVPMTPSVVRVFE
jgi:hypothetical protein